MKDLSNSRFMQTVRSQHTVDADELKAQFCEFDLRYFGRKKGDGSSLFHKEIARKTDDLSLAK